MTLEEKLSHSLTQRASITTQLLKDVAECKFLFKTHKVTFTYHCNHRTPIF